MPASKREKHFDYDVTLSFAGEDRPYVDEVAGVLASSGVRVFYDNYEQVDMWGKDLYSHLSEIYSKSAKYCVMFVSKAYKKKLWTNHERRSAQERAFQESREYILPARFDNTPIPGLLSTTGYINISKMTPIEFARMIESKVIELPRSNYFPLNPDKLEKVLSKRLRIRSPKTIAKYKSSAYRLFNMMSRLNTEERTLIILIAVLGCVQELPDNLHIDLEMLRRRGSFVKSRIEKIAHDIRSLGFYIDIGTTHHSERFSENSNMIRFEWADLNSGAPPHQTSLLYYTLLQAASRQCETCAFESLLRLDFSQLSSATTYTDPHYEHDELNSLE